MGTVDLYPIVAIFLIIIPTLFVCLSKGRSGTKNYIQIRGSSLDAHVLPKEDHPNNKRLMSFCGHHLSGTLRSCDPDLSQGTDAVEGARGLYELNLMTNPPVAARGVGVFRVGGCPLVVEISTEVGSNEAVEGGRGLYELNLMTNPPVAARSAAICRVYPGPIDDAIQQKVNQGPVKHVPHASSNKNPNKNTSPDQKSDNSEEMRINNSDDRNGDSSEGSESEHDLEISQLDAIAKVYFVPVNLHGSQQMERGPGSKKLMSHGLEFEPPNNAPPNNAALPITPLFSGLGWSPKKLISNKNGSSTDLAALDRFGLAILAAANVFPECLNFSSSPMLNSNLKSNHKHELNKACSKHPFKSPRDDNATFFVRDSSDISHNFSDAFIFSPSRRYDDNQTIFVGGMTKFTTEKSLYEYFLRFGAITGCSLARNKLTAVSKDYGSVEFESIEQAKKASEFLSHVIDDKEVGVKLGRHTELRQKFKLFVGGLSKETSVETLRKYFSKYGNVVECNIPRNIDNSSRGFGYVAFNSEESINNVLNLSPHYIDNKAVGVKYTTVRQSEFTLMTKKLSPNTTDESLREFYSRFGQLTESEVKLDRQTGQSRGFGYVSFCSQKELDSAIEVNTRIIDGVKVELHYKTDEFDMIVTNLTPNITEKSLNDYFSCYEELRRCEIKESLPGVRTGFVKFWIEKEVLKALADRPHIINGKRVHCFQNDQDFAVYIGNLPFDATDDLLFETFSKFGKLVRWNVKRDHDRNCSLGYGYVSFETAEQAVQAVNGVPHFMKGRTLRVESDKRQTLSKKSIK
ncbi:RNA recognition motif domain-containing protein [Ditylenchus destructor]|nr:RNA recognition motif domain-containing protein [Ditylenchus destructor]